MKAWRDLIRTLFQFADYSTIARLQEPRDIDLSRYQVLPAHCVGCRHQQDILYPRGKFTRDREQDLLDQLVCTNCGQYTLVADSVPDIQEAQ